ncbi:MAG: TspO/MBR family protein [Acidimicrobiaceae bacterium]
MTRGVVSTVSTIIVIIYAVGAGRWVSTDAGWYRSLNQPSWQPPDVVFGLIWPYNFAVLIIAGFVVASRDSRTEQIIWLASLALSVAAALLWAWLFYVPHSLQASGFALGAAALLTVPLVLIAFRASPLLGLALMPYEVWVAIATSLAFGYATRN